MSGGERSAGMERTARAGGGEWRRRVLEAHVIAELRRRLPDGARVVDAGCGSGGLLAALRRARVPWELAGFDASVLSVEQARARGFRAVVPAPAESLPIRGGGREAVVCLDLLGKACVDEGAVIEEMGRVLRPGGWLMVNVPAWDVLGAGGGGERRYGVGRLRELLPRDEWEVELVHGWDALGVLPAMLGRRGGGRSWWPRWLSGVRASLGEMDLAVCRALRLPVGTELFAVVRKRPW